MVKKITLFDFIIVFYYLNKMIKIKDDNTFRYKNINGRIEYTEIYIYIYI